MARAGSKFETQSRLELFKRRATAMRFEDKRERRELKRDLKRKGNQRIRRLIKRRLAEDPNTTTDPEIDDDPDYGRYRSSLLNGLDRDRTRLRADR